MDFRYLFVINFMKGLALILNGEREIVICTFVKMNIYIYIYIYIYWYIIN